MENHSAYFIFKKQQLTKGVFLLLFHMSFLDNHYTDWYTIDKEAHMDNRENILKSALHLFYAKGYDAVGVQEIAEAAQVTKPTLYHYFGSKYGLLESLIETYYSTFSQALEQAAVYEGDLPLTLYRTAKIYFGLVAENKEFYKLVMSMMYSGEESDSYKASEGIRKHQHHLFTRLFEKAGDMIGNMNGRQEQYAITFIGFLNTYLLYWFSRDGRNGDTVSDEQAFAVVHQFLHGIYV